jgi:hypothetical protein
MTNPIQPEDRALALLVLASAGRMMLATPQDVVALVDFVEEEGQDCPGASA